MRLKTNSWRVSEAERSPARVNFFHEVAVGIVGRHLLEEQVTVPLNDREQVIEVVGHAPGELTDRLHLLGLAELAFEASSLGQVQDEEHSRIDDAVPKGSGRDENRDAIPRFTDVLFLVGEADSAHPYLLQGVLIQVAVLRRGEFRPEHLAGLHFRGV